ncbi:hypothetical protein IWW39_005453 [Coemansia spiralis]|uniref:Uncharacterized protein n=1 Tax=Coemansia spiralis TaxID=417178 RepID=A0A9W8GH32_9FUNG|nr:hypothetical protein IWW39_005453 [Coemansia spiralis]
MLTSPLLRGGSWSPASQIFLAIAACQAIVNISLESCFISRLRSHQPEISHQTSLYIVYDSGFIAAQLFAFLLSYAALHVRSEPLVTAATAFDLLLLLTQAAQLAQTGPMLGMAALQAISIAVLAVGGLGKTWLVWRQLKKQFGWQVYRALGADLKMQRMFYYHQILLSLATLAAFFFLELWLQLATITKQTNGREGGWMLNIIILFVCAVVLCMCLFAAVQELLWLMYGSVGVLAVSPAFFIYKLVVVNRHVAVDEVDAYAAGRKYMTFFLVIILLLDIALTAVSLVVARTFGKGLRQRLRHFQILARGEVDLETMSRAGPSVQMSVSSSMADVPPTQPVSPLGLTMMLTGAKSSLKESSLHFRALFSGLDLPSNHETVRSQHRASVEKWEQDTPSLANPQLINMFDSPASSTSCVAPRGLGASSLLSGSEKSLAPPPKAQSKGAQHSPIASSSSMQFGSRSTAHGTFVLSAEELDSINGPSLSAPMATTLPAAQAFSWSVVSHTAPLIGTTAASSLPPREVADKGARELAQTGDYASDCALYNTLQGPLGLRVANPDSLSDDGRDNGDFGGSRAMHAPPVDTVRSVLSEATSADASVGIAQGSLTAMAEEGFDPSS